VPTRKKLLAVLVGAIAVAGATATTGLAQDTGDNDVRPLKANQTEGFVLGRTQVFTYAQNFHCTIEPFDDLDGIGRQGDGVPAASDPDEMILNNCITGETRGGAEPTIDPAGVPVPEARKFWAVVPTFDANGNGIPEALDPDPGVDLQCPEPGAPTHEEKTSVGACTMHPSLVFVDPILDEIGTEFSGLELPDPLENLLQPSGELPVEEPFVETETDEQLWWQVIVVLVNDPAVWPSFDGECAAGGDRCLTSLEALRASQADGGSGRDIPTNIWLFFANQPLAGGGEAAEHAGHRG
jgi:hypothetical protein